MVTKQNLPTKKPQDRRKHPEPWQTALNPKQRAAQTSAAPAVEPPDTRPASEIKPLVRMLQDFTRDELDQLAVMEPGARLRTGAIYVDLADPARRPFKAESHASAGEKQYCVAKAHLARPLWNRLVRVPEPERDKGRTSRAETGASANVPRKSLPAARRPAMPRGPRHATLRPQKPSKTRFVAQGDNEVRGGRERSERRGAGAVGKVNAPARHARARAH